MGSHLKEQEQGKNWISKFYYRKLKKYIPGLGRKTLTLSYAILVFFTSPQTIRNNLYNGISGIYRWEKYMEIQSVLVSCSCIAVILFLMWGIDRFFYYLLTTTNVQEPSFLQITQPVTILTQQEKRKELEEVLAPVKHHALHDHPVIEPSLSNITTSEESKLIFDYLGFNKHLCLKNDFIRSFKSKKILLEAKDESFRRQLHYQKARLIFYRKIMYCSLVFIFFTFGYHIYKEQKTIENQTTIAATENKQEQAKQEPVKQEPPIQLSIYYVYLLYIVLFLLGYMGYVKQSQNINLLIFRVFVKRMQVLQKKRYIYFVSCPD